MNAIRWHRVAFADRARVVELLLAAEELRATRRARPTYARCQWCGAPMLVAPTAQVRRYCRPPRRCSSAADYAQTTIAASSSPLRLAKFQHREARSA